MAFYSALSGPLNLTSYCGYCLKDIYSLLKQNIFLPIEECGSMPLKGLQYTLLPLIKVWQHLSYVNYLTVLPLLCLGELAPEQIVFPGNV